MKGHPRNSKVLSEKTAIRAESMAARPATIKIVDFEPEHYQRIRLRREDARDLQGLSEESLFEAWKGGRTLLYGDEVVLFYGTGIHQGTGYIWTVTSDLVGKLPLLVTRLGLNMIRALFKSGCHRIEVFCHSKNQRSLNWLTRSLGFRVEGLLRKSGPNRQDRYILSIVK